MMKYFVVIKIVFLKTTMIYKNVYEIFLCEKTSKNKNPDFYDLDFIKWKIYNKHAYTLHGHVHKWNKL